MLVELPNGDAINSYLADKEQHLQHTLRAADSKLRARLDAICMAQRLAMLVLPPADDASTDHSHHSHTYTQDTVAIIMRMVSVLLRRLFEAGQQAELLALVTLLSGLCIARPLVLPTCLPALVSRYEQLLGGASATTTQSSLLHALRNALASIMSSPAAEPYYPLLMDALSKQPKTAGTGGKRRAIDDDQPLDTLEHASQKRIDICKIPLDTVVDCLIGSLQYVESAESVMAVVERWRPTVGSLGAAASVADVERADPRRRLEEPIAPLADGVAAGVTEQVLVEPEASDPLLFIRHLLINRLILKGCQQARSFNRHRYPCFVGRLLNGLERFGVDLHDDLCDALFPASGSGGVVDPDGCAIMADYLSSLYFTTSETGAYSEKMVKLLVMLPVEFLGPVCLSLPVIDYDTLVPVLRQHLAPDAGDASGDTAGDASGDASGDTLGDASGDTGDMNKQKAQTTQPTIDPKIAQTVMSLIGDLRRSRPNDEWSLLRQLLVECCQSGDVLVRGMAVGEAVPFLDITDARSILHLSDGDDGAGDTDGGAAERGDGQRLDLPMAIAQRHPSIVVDLLQQWHSSAYLTARLFTLLPMLTATSAEAELLQVYRDTGVQYQDFWLRLLGLKSAATPPSLYHTVIACFVAHPDHRTLQLIVERAPKEALPGIDPLQLTCAAVSVIDIDEHQQMARFLEFMSAGVGADTTLHSLLRLPYAESAMAACQTALSMATLFKAHVWLSSLTRLLDSGTVGVLAMRAALLALTLHKQALTQPYLSLSTKHLALFTDNPDLQPLLLKQIRVTLPHSLHLFTALPVQVQRDALRVDAAVELRKPVKEYLYGLPPSVRSRYQQLMRLLE